MYKQESDIDFLITTFVVDSYVLKLKQSSSCNV